MANLYVAVHDGGKTGEEGATRLLNKLAGNQNKGRVGTGDFLVSQHSSPNMSVDIATGDYIIPYSSYFFHGWSTAIQVVTISSADPSNPRIDRVVAYIDLAVVGTTNSNNPDAIKLKSVAGSAAGSPTRPNDATVQASVGSGNPFVDLADVRVEAAVTSILDAKITDKRDLFNLGGGVGGAQFGVIGNMVVANDVSPYWIAPKPGTFTAVYAYIKTAPTGAALNLRLNKNGVSVATPSISAGAQTGNSTGLAVSFAAGDYFSLDITQVGSTVAGQDLTVAIG